MHRQGGEKQWEAVSPIGPEEVRGDASKDTWVFLDEMNCDQREWRGEVMNAEAERREVVSK